MFTSSPTIVMPRFVSCPAVIRRCTLGAVATVVAATGTASAQPATGQVGPTLRAMTYNVRYASSTPPNSWPERRPVALALLRQWAPDVVGMQEAVYEQVKDFSSALPSYRWIGLGREGGSRGEFMAVFYRADRLEPVEYDHFWLSDTPETIGSRSWGNNSRRMVTWVRFRDRRTRGEFVFVNTHLDHKSDQSQWKSVELILDRANRWDRRLPVLLVGDFNALDGDSTYKALTRPDAFSDGWRAAARRGEEMSSSHGFEGIEAARGIRLKTGKPKTRKDWILTRGPVHVRSIEVVTFSQDGQYPSDHFPVSADVVMNVVTRADSVVRSVHTSASAPTVPQLRAVGLGTFAPRRGALRSTNAAESSQDHYRTRGTTHLIGPLEIVRCCLQPIVPVHDLTGAPDLSDHGLRSRSDVHTRLGSTFTLGLRGR